MRYSPKVSVLRNTVSDPNATNLTGIVVTDRPGAKLGTNFTYVDVVGIDAEGDSPEINGNTVGSPTRSPTLTQTAELGVRMRCEPSTAPHTPRLGLDLTVSKASAASSAG